LHRVCAAFAPRLRRVCAAFAPCLHRAKLRVHAVRPFPALFRLFSDSFSGIIRLLSGDVSGSFRGCFGRRFGRRNSGGDDSPAFDVQRRLSPPLPRPRPWGGWLISGWPRLSRWDPF
jgi:hypothetical protein